MNNKSAIGRIEMSMKCGVLKIAILHMSNEIIITDDITYHTRIKRYNELRNNTSDMVYDIRYCSNFTECLLELNKVLANTIENLNSISNVNIVDTAQPGYGTLTQVMTESYNNMCFYNDFTFRTLFMLYNNTKNPIKFYHTLHAIEEDNQ